MKFGYAYSPVIRRFWFALKVIHNGTVYRMRVRTYMWPFVLFSKEKV